MINMSCSDTTNMVQPQSVPSNRRVVNVILLNDKSFPVTVEVVTVLCVSSW